MITATRLIEMTMSSSAPLPVEFEIRSSLPTVRAALTEKQERFAQIFAVGLNQTAAYREAFDCSKMLDSTVRGAASQLMDHPSVANRIEELRDAHARRLFGNHAVTIARLLEIETEIALANPNDLVQWLVTPCRRCHGENHQRQWIEIEYIEAIDAWEKLDAKTRALTPMPDIAGGLGYDGKAAPNPECPFCLGKGDGRQVIKDTRYLPPGARRLYAGIKSTRQGVEVLMHDQTAAQERIGRMLGAYKDTLRLTGGIGLLNVTLPADPLEAERAYRSMINGDG